MRRSTFLRELEKVREYSYYIEDSLKKLEGTASTLVTREGIMEMFRKDVDLIKEDYKKGDISRREAKQSLQDLLRITDELERYVLEIRKLFLKLEEISHSILRKLIEPPEFGVPITVVKGEIREFISQTLEDEIPKREFGVLEVANLSENECKQKINGFIDEYSSGLVITQPELESFIIKILNSARVRFEAKKVGMRIIFTVEGFE